MATIGFSACSSGGGVPISSPELSNIDFKIVHVGQHQYLVYNPGQPNGLMCHYEDCDNPIHKIWLGVTLRDTTYVMDSIRLPFIFYHSKLIP